jgi:CheY-like chemotaxis protein
MTQTPPFFIYRVLIVDDNEMALRTLRRQLEDEGFYVRTALNESQALDLMQEERFHVAVVDLRLVDTDMENRAGLRLIDDLHAIDPTLAAIILTGNADFASARRAMDQTRNQNAAFRLWTSPAFKFLEKTPEDLLILPDTIREAFERVHGVNLGLQIELPPEFIDTAIKRMALRSTSSDDLTRFREEVDELLRKLFREWEYLAIEPVTANPGYSRAMVFKAMPSGERGQGEVNVAKIGAWRLIEREIRAYRTYIRGLAGNFVPTAIEPAWRTRSLGGMVYTYAGLGGDIHDFAEDFHASDPDALASLVDTLFRRTMSWQTRRGARVHQGVDLRALFFTLLRLQPDELIEARDQLADGRDALSLEVGGLRVNSFALRDPVDYALNTQMTGDYAETNVHGDLHIHNILIDDQRNAWLIDFANAAAAPLFYDHAFLEMSIRIELVASEDASLLAAWASLLTAPDGISAPLPPDLTADPTIVKAHRAIEGIRRFVMRGRADEVRRSLRLYRMMLFFIALRLTTVRFLAPARKRHALIAAAFLADALSRE